MIDISELFESEDEIEDRKEDRLIQPDGSRACISYELANNGYHLVNLQKRDLNKFIN